MYFNNWPASWTAAAGRTLPAGSSSVLIHKRHHFHLISRHYRSLLRRRACLYLNYSEGFLRRSRGGARRLPRLITGVRFSSCNRQWRRNDVERASFCRSVNTRVKQSSCDSSPPPPPPPPVSRLLLFSLSVG